MLVLCNGMPRSASTWSFNVVKMLLETTYEGQPVCGGYDEDIARFLESVPESARHIVLKCHTLNAVGRALAASGAAKVVYTWRSVADALASFVDMFHYDFEHAFAVMSASLELYRFHQRRGDAAIVSYEEITRHPDQAVRRIARCLFDCERELGPDLVDQVVNAHSIERMREKVEQLGRITGEGHLIRLERTVYDPETLLNLGHIRDGGHGYGRLVLSPEQAGRVDALLAQYGLAELAG